MKTRIVKVCILGLSQLLFLGHLASGQAQVGEPYQPDEQVTDPCLIGDPIIWGEVCQRYDYGIGAADCGPYDSKTTCTQQTESLDQCVACCSAILACNIAKGKRKDIAESEYRACEGHCYSDKT